MKIAQIGCGYWGPNLLRALINLNADIYGIVELCPSRKKFLRENFPDIPQFDSLDSILKTPSVDAVIIATPAETHYSLVKQALLHDKHVLVEKPLTTNSHEAKELCVLAKHHELVLMVGHTFLYNDAVKWIKTKGLTELGPLFYGYSQRLNLGRIRTDVNAWWNLAPHDISIFLYLMNDELPETISVQGQSFIQKDIEDVVIATLQWKNGFFASIHVSWLDPSKTRYMTLVGKDKMLVFDDVSSEKIRVYNKSIKKQSVVSSQMDYDIPQNYTFYQNSGEVRIPEIDIKEPLLNEISHFIEAIREKGPVISGPSNGLNVVKVLEAGNLSLKRGGESVWITEAESILV